MVSLAMKLLASGRWRFVLLALSLALGCCAARLQGCSRPTRCRGVLGRRTLAPFLVSRDWSASVTSPLDAPSPVLAGVRPAPSVAADPLLSVLIRRRLWPSDPFRWHLLPDRRWSRPPPLLALHDANSSLRGDAMLSCRLRRRSVSPSGSVSFPAGLSSPVGPASGDPLPPTSPIALALERLLPSPASFGSSLTVGSFPSVACGGVASPAVDPEPPEYDWRSMMCSFCNLFGYATKKYV